MSADSRGGREAGFKCLIIQLGGLGDLMQSLMALRAAKQLYPNVSMHLLVDSVNEEAARRIPWIDGVIAFPSDRFAGAITRGLKTNTQVVSEIAGWLAPHIDEAWSLLANWSYTESSSFLSSLIPSRVKLGYHRGADQTLQCADGWSYYVQAVVGETPQNIHLIDILTTQLLTALQFHVGDPDEVGGAPVTSKEFFTVEPTARASVVSELRGARRWIGIQLGAERRGSEWTPDGWARLISQILRRHPDYSVALFGTSRDRASEWELLEALNAEDADSSRVISLVGRMDFSGWTAAVARCHWVISADSSVLHLASVLGTRVLMLADRNSRWSESGPYGNGHYVVAPLAAEASVRDIAAGSVYAALSYAMSEWSHQRKKDLNEHFSQLGWSRLVQHTHVYRSRIRPTSDGGGVVYEPSLHRAGDVNDWVSMVMGQVARAWYCGWVAPIGQDLGREFISPDLIQELRKISASTDVFKKICEQAVRTAGELHEQTSRLRSEKVMGVGDRQRIQDLGSKLTEMETLIERLSGETPAFQAFARMSKVMMHNLRGANIAEMSRESADCYRQLIEGIDIVSDWARHTLGMARPMAVTRLRTADSQEVKV